VRWFLPVKIFVSGKKQVAIGGNNKRFMSEINVTPLVDVMLVLLIIFMVTAPMMIQGVEVNLPRTTTKSIKSPEDPLILTVTKNKELFIENHRLTLETVDVKLQNILKYRRDKQILIKADKDIPYGFVIQVISRIKRAGIDKLGMITEPENK